MVLSVRGTKLPLSFSEIRFSDLFSDSALSGLHRLRRELFISYRYGLMLAGAGALSGLLVEDADALDIYGMDQYDDSLSGGSGSDVLLGYGGRDTLDGGAGNDYIEGGAGADSIDGGAGIDWVSYRHSNAGVTIDLEARTGSGGDAAGDTLANIENIHGSRYNDILTGDSKANFIDGRTGHDVLNGGAGNDRLIGGTGRDTLNGGGDNDFIEGGAAGDSIDGGTGEDLVSYWNSDAGVAIDLEAGTGSGGDADGDTLANIEHIFGSRHSDILKGTEYGNLFNGGAGSDSIDGRGGEDTVTYWSSNEGVTIDLETRTASGGHAAGDTLANIEHIVGSNYSDTLKGTEGNNFFEGEFGADSIDGRGGIDTASYARSNAGVTIDLEAGTGSGGDAAGDTLINIEHIIGSSQDDSLTGDADANKLDGRGGEDTVSYASSNANVFVDLSTGTALGGHAAGDTLISIEHIIGSRYNDILEGSANANKIDGGSGRDAVLYWESNAGVTVDLGTGTGSGGDAAGDTLANIEHIIGSRYNDILTGDGDGNIIEGGAGGDRVEGGAGGDRVDGGAGEDTVSYASSDAGVTIDLETGTASGGHAAGDTLISIEHIIGSSHDDSLTGDADANKLDGGGGADTVSYASSYAGVTVDLFASLVRGGHAAGDTLMGIEHIIGSSHDDRFRGDANANKLDGGGGEDVVSYARSNAGVTIDLETGMGSGGHAEGDTLANIEHIYGSIYNDILKGTEGNNRFEGGRGADSIDGRGGEDTVSYLGINAGVTIDLEAGTGSGGDAAGDTLANIEHIIGSYFNDSLTGDSGDNKLEGGRGNDTLYSGGGSDTLDGGSGIDTLRLTSDLDFADTSLTLLSIEAIDLRSDSGAQVLSLSTRDISSLSDDVGADGTIILSVSVGEEDSVKFNGADVTEDVVVGGVRLSFVSVEGSSSPPSFAERSFSYTSSFDVESALDFSGYGAIASVSVESATGSVDIFDGAGSLAKFFDHFGVAKTTITFVDGLKVFAGLSGDDDVLARSAMRDEFIITQGIDTVANFGSEDVLDFAIYGSIDTATVSVDGSDVLFSGADSAGDDFATTLSGAMDGVFSTVGGSSASLVDSLNSGVFDDLFANFSPLLFESGS